MTSGEIAEKGLVFKAVVGSTVHGLALEGADDRDEMGVCVEPPECVVGLRHFEQYVYRTQPEGVPSGPGDVDRTIYSLRKWCRLALNGNPTVLLLLFVPNVIWGTHGPLRGIGFELREHPEWFASRRAGRAFLGYMEAQRQRLTGERGQKRVRRPEVEAAHGYDTKYAMHVLRLGLQGREFLRTGRITLPVSEPERSALLGIRLGGYPIDKVLTWAGELERDVRDLLEGGSPLPAEPNRDAVEAFLVRSYRLAWGWE